MKRDLYVAPTRRLFAFALLLLLVSQAAISFYAWSVIEDKIRPGLDRKAATVGTSVAGKIARALDYGIPFDKLEGIEEFFDDILKENADVAFLALADANGQVVSVRGLRRDDVGALAGKGRDAMLVTRVDLDAGHFFDTPVPIRQGDRIVGVLHVGVDRGFIASRISDLRYDIGIILLTSMLIAFEILLFVVTLNFSGPMRQIGQLMSRMASGDFSYRAAVSVKETLGSLAERLNRISARVNQAFSDRMRIVSDAAAGNPDAARSMTGMLARLKSRYVFADAGEVRNLAQQRIVSIRILTFLFMFAEMLSRSFMPLYVGTLPDSGLAGLGFAPDFTASLPLTANLLGVACSMPFAGRWSDRMGRRRSYAVGAAIIIAGLAGTGMASDFFTLTAARVLAGVGYALMFMSCQGYVIDHTDENNRGRGIASFVGAIMVAEICAPAVGGILADRIGYRLVFGIGAAIALAAMILAVRTLDNASARKIAQADERRAPPVSLARNFRFMAISILAGIPAKLLLSGFLIYLVPVILTGFGSSKSEIGRYAMTYGVMALALTPVFAKLTDRYRIHAWMVGTGGILAGAGLLPILVHGEAGTMLLGIAMLGLGQSMSISAQLVLVTQVTRKEAETAGTAGVLGVFRLIERLGGAAGPAVAGALAALYGPKQAMAVLGAFGAISSVLFLVIFLAGGRGNVPGRSAGKTPDTPDARDTTQESAA